MLSLSLPLLVAPLVDGNTARDPVSADEPIKLQATSIFKRMMAEIEHATPVIKLSFADLQLLRKA